jgi:hypothetical protein
MDARFGDAPISADGASSLPHKQDTPYDAGRRFITPDITVYALLAYSG